MTNKGQDLRSIFTTDPNAAVAYTIMEEICLPYGYGARTAWSESMWFKSEESSSPYDGVFEDAWPWLAKNVLHTVTTLERDERVRVDTWTSAKTGDFAGTPDLVLPVTSFVTTTRRLPSISSLRAYIDLADASERVEAHARLFGCVPADRILAVWRWANETARMGEVVGHKVTWAIDGDEIVHSMDGSPVTRRAVTQLGAAWVEIESLHSAAKD